MHNEAYANAVGIGAEPIDKRPLNDEMASTYEEICQLRGRLADVLDRVRGTQLQPVSKINPDGPSVIPQSNMRMNSYRIADVVRECQGLADQLAKEIG